MENEKARFAGLFSVELAGLEPATSWVRDIGGRTTRANLTTQGTTLKRAAIGRPRGGRRARMNAAQVRAHRLRCARRRTLAARPRPVPPRDECPGHLRLRRRPVQP